MPGTLIIRAAATNDKKDLFFGEIFLLCPLLLQTGCPHIPRILSRLARETDLRPCPAMYGAYYECSCGLKAEASADDAGETPFYPTPLATCMSTNLFTDVGVKRPY